MKLLAAGVPAVVVGDLTSEAAAQVEQAMDWLVHVADVMPPSPAGSSSVDALAFTASVVTGSTTVSGPDGEMTDVGALFIRWDTQIHRHAQPHDSQ